MPNDIDTRWRVRIRESIGSLEMEVQFFRKAPYQPGKYEVMTFGEVKVETYDANGAGFKAPVGLLLDRETLGALAAAMNELGFRTDRDGIIEGKLGATERHLEDMRTLVFKDKKPS